jgi:hypothetical protein
MSLRVVSALAAFALLVACGDAPDEAASDVWLADDADGVRPALRYGEDPRDIPDELPPPQPTARAHAHVRFLASEPSPCGTQITLSGGYWKSAPLFASMPEPQKSRHCRFTWYSTSSAAAPLSAITQRYPKASVRLLSVNATPPGTKGNRSYAPDLRPSCEGPFFTPSKTCPPSHGCESCNGTLVGDTLYGWTATPATSFSVIQYVEDFVQITHVTLPYAAQTFTVPNFDTASTYSRGFDILVRP